MSSVSLILNLDSLRQLPSGAGYTARHGRASVRVTRIPPTATKPGHLLVEAGCDSLELLCASYARTVSTLRQQLEAASDAHKKASEEHSPFGPRKAFITFIAGVVAGIVTTLLTRRIWKKVF